MLTVVEGSFVPTDPNGAIYIFLLFYFYLTTATLAGNNPHDRDCLLLITGENQSLSLVPVYQHRHFISQMTNPSVADWILWERV